MTLVEAKTLLRGMQQTMAEEQIEEYLAQHANCPHCGRHRSKKGEHNMVFHTVFGKLKLTSPRLYHPRILSWTGSSVRFPAFLARV